LLDGVVGLVDANFEVRKGARGGFLMGKFTSRAIDASYGRWSGQVNTPSAIVQPHGIRTSTICIVSTPNHAPN
jgi:hypothetical protein